MAKTPTYQMKGRMMVVLAGMIILGFGKDLRALLSLSSLLLFFPPMSANFCPLSICISFIFQVFLNVADCKRRLATAMKVAAVIAIGVAVVVMMLYYRAVLTELTLQISSERTKLNEEITCAEIVQIISGTAVGILPLQSLSSSPS